VRVSGRVCLITGSTGIAAATAELLAADGWRLMVCSRTEPNCRGLAERLGCACFAGDLAEDATAGRAVAAAVERFGRLDAAFNVAGISGRRYGDGPTHEATPDGWDATLDANARSMFLSCRAEIQQMLGQPPSDADGMRGAILNMASVLAFSPSPALFATHAYAASKGAILAMTRSMAARYAPERIRVNAIAPGLTRTPMSQRAQSDERVLQFAARKQPLVGGMLEAGDVAGAAAFLLGRHARAVTGAVLVVDGGWSVTEAVPEG
jgi:NAD(P)-dependent dehydrogenase (short-subunit alcohol dehydrogenase family)